MADSINPFALAQRIKRPLILDGAMGSLLQQKGFKVDSNIWTTKLNHSNPQTIISIHKSYINSGADIITTNSFRTNLTALKKSGIENNKKYVRQAVILAIEAKKNLSIYIAGSNPPAEDCYQSIRNITNKILQVNHYNHIDLLYTYGVHFILNETQSHFDEIKIICKYCSKNSIPYLISLYSDNGRTILSGELITDVIKFILDYNPLSIGFNCISLESFKKIDWNNNSNYPRGMYLNCGATTWNNKFKTEVSAIQYSNFVSTYLKLNLSFIGACCGSTPKHIEAIKGLIDG